MLKTQNAAQKILVVDDADINLMMLEEILKDDYEVFTASNGMEALDFLRRAEILPKIILLDVQMPVMGGREVFEFLKADESSKRIPVIFITADNGSEGELLAAGAADFINKPFTAEVVKLRVKNQIALKEYSNRLEEMVIQKTEEVVKKTEEANAILNNALQGLANVIEHRDIESGGHVRRTQLYLDILVNYLIESKSMYADEISKMQPEIIAKSMALHDVGKIAIPDRILLKPGRLDPDEYEIMKTHTIRGKEIIGEMGDTESSLYLKHSENICYGHHERWDGKGYPRGIKGGQIPLAARLAAVADVYDSLVCRRVYKKQISSSESVEIIFSGSGTQFDPVLVEAFEKVKGEFQKIAEKHS